MYVIDQNVSDQNVIDQNVIAHIAKYSTIHEFLERDYHFEWDVRALIAGIDDERGAVAGGNSGGDSARYQIILRVVGRNTFILYAAVTINQNFDVVGKHIAKGSYAIADGKVQLLPENHMRENNMFAHAIPMFGTETMISLVAREIGRFMNAKVPHACSSRVRIPYTGKIVRTGERPDEVKWLPFRDGLCYGFIIAIAGVFGMTSWMRISIVWNSMDQGYIYLIKRIITTDMRPIVPVYLALHSSPTRDMIACEIRSLKIDDDYLETIISQIMRFAAYPNIGVICGPGTTENIDVVMSEILGSAYIPRKDVLVNPYLEL